MTRINVYTAPDEYATGYHAYTHEPQLLGWFDPKAAEVFEQDKRWDGSNMIGVITGSQWIDESLYRTKGGRWVLNSNASRYHSGPNTYTFITGEQARDWLLRSECNDEAIARFFGEIEDERGPGRPKVGDQVCFTVPADVLTDLDAIAERDKTTRSALLRRATIAFVTAGKLA
jgi:hypothetical protein